MVLILITSFAFLPVISSAQGWGPATNLGPNINTSAIEAGSSITVDSSKLYFTSDRAGGQGAYDIWVSEYNNGWQTPINLGSNINTSDYDLQPSISSDGSKLYFSSDRPGGLGSFDIYVSEYAGGVWQPATNLGPNVNSAEMELCPSVSADGMRLYFESGRAGGYGLTDIWISKYSGGSWQPAINLGDSINTFRYESEPIESNDGLTLYFSSNRPGTLGGYDIWQSANVGGVWQSPINLGSNINTTLEETSPDISSNSTKLYFAAAEWNGGYGDYDIWVSEYQPGVEEMSANTIKQYNYSATIINGPLHLPADKNCKVFDITGRVVEPTTITRGIYFIEIDGMVTQKVVKVR